MPMLEALDTRIFLALYGGSLSAPLRVTALVITYLGSGWMMLPLVPLLVRPRTRAFATALTLALLTTAAFVFVTKAAVGRPRPFVALPHVHALFDSPRDPSFPSGHSAGAFTAAAFLSSTLWHRARRINPRPVRLRALAIAGALFAFASAIAVSRIVLGVHYPFDALVGAALGTTVGGVAARIDSRRRWLGAS